MISLYQKFSDVCSWLVQPFASLAARLYIANDFFSSGLLKLEDWEDTLDLFSDDWALPLLPAVPSAYLATTAELVLPVLLVLGLFTRFAALGLFVMAVVIELFVFPGTVQHYYWMLILALLVGHGGGKFSVDKFLFKSA